MLRQGEVQALCCASCIIGLSARGGFNNLSTLLSLLNMTLPCSAVKDSRQAHPILLSALCWPLQASSGHLPTSSAPAGPRGTEPKRTWQQRLRSTWQQHPTLALCFIGLFLTLVAAILGVAIGVSARNRGRFPAWGKGVCERHGETGRDRELDDMDCMCVVFLTLVAALLGMAIGVSTRDRGRFPSWGKGV